MRIVEFNNGKFAVQDTLNIFGFHIPKRYYRNEPEPNGIVLKSAFRPEDELSIRWNGMFTQSCCFDSYEEAVKHLRYIVNNGGEKEFGVAKVHEWRIE